MDFATCQKLLAIYLFPSRRLATCSWFLLPGAVPFPSDVPRLKQLGVGGELSSFVRFFLYNGKCLDQFVRRLTVLFGYPRMHVMARLLKCIAKRELRGRSTTVVEYKHMTPAAALVYVRSRSPLECYWLLLSGRFKRISDKSTNRVGQSEHYRSDSTRVGGRFRECEA
ncbi:PREDICTED: putative dual specificity protein phosphatase DSP8 [Nicotiana attenuata]|uniref:putative dual specificity protein phosphatase DSP8 n=1 Tax=Nicotiana attenuata TaxID=49451 RepID=UPI000905545F|nr:PREDICTED: putative dual specificity protein phosphatase DSP8 [Nicotiana attenuata]